MKVWIFEETGEVRGPIHGEWYLSFTEKPFMWNGPKSLNEYKILKLTEYPSNPLAPIREVWDRIHIHPKCVYSKEEERLLYENAISQAMAILEEK